MHAQHTHKERILLQMTWKSVYPVLRGCRRPMKTVVLVSYWGEAVNVQLLKLWHTRGHVTRLWLCSTSDSARDLLSQLLYKACDDDDDVVTFVYIAIYTVQIVPKQLKITLHRAGSGGKCFSVQGKISFLLCSHCAEEIVFGYINEVYKHYIWAAKWLSSASASFIVCCRGRGV